MSEINGDGHADVASEAIDATRTSATNVSIGSRRVDEVIATTGIDVHPKKRRRLERMSAVELRTYELRMLLTTACKDLNPTLAFKIYCDARASGTLPTVDVMNNVLSMLAGLGEPGSGCSRTRNPEGNLAAAVEIYEDAKRANMFLRESSYAALIRCFCKLGDDVRALELYREVQATGQTLKHRALSPLLEALALKKKSELCFGLYDEMVNKYELIPLERDYTSMLRLCLSTNDARFIEILQQMMEDVLIPMHRNSIDVIKEYFTSMSQYDFIEGARAQLSGQLTLDGNDVSDGEKVKLIAQHSLRSIDLTEEQRASLLSEITRAAENRIENGRPGSGGNAAQGTETAPNGSAKRKRDGSLAAWTDFVAYIQQRQKNRAEEVAAQNNPAANLSLSPVDVIVDGANVGYYKQNYAGAPSHIDYFQVDAMVRYLESTGRRPLIFLHMRHLRPGVVPGACAGLVGSWEQRGMLYKAPAGCNDDWFWLYAAVAWRCQVVTNDEMRDHHFRMLSPRWFNRWKERNQIHFSFDTGLTKDTKTNLVANDKRAAVAVTASQATVSSSTASASTITTSTTAATTVLSGSESIAESSSSVAAPAAASTSSASTSGFQVGLRRRNIQLRVPLPYSCRMQHSADAAAPSYYIPLVKKLLSSYDDEDVEEEHGDVSEDADNDEGAEKAGKTVFKTVFRETVHPSASSSTSAGDGAAPATAPATTSSNTYSSGLGRQVSATTTFVAGTTDEPDAVTWLCFLRK